MSLGDIPQYVPEVAEFNFGLLNVSILKHGGHPNSDSPFKSLPVRLVTNNDLPEAKFVPMRSQRVEGSIRDHAKHEAISTSAS